MLGDWLIAPMSWLGLALVPFLLVVIIVVLIVKGD